ncbi:hypothetical protein H2199_001492 [Coniosporium tulheliwenetii]|uniref:Uncharacterized protein n=1 Tax=Coniosporium tulheliwenetii TaxID=3383036 RepID=A0ACC2ZM49_9PEZI|nr:hypothetical protein H2199_001492 [Cladosporium sp. JES 115]
MTRPTFQRLLIKHLSAYKINKPFPHSHLFTKSLIYGSWRSSAWFQERSKCLQLKSVTFAFAFLGSAGLAYWASGALTSKDRVADVNKTKSELNDNVPEVTIGRLTRDHSKVHRRFVYSPLDHGYKTRLLILEPGNFDDEVTCQLKHSSSLKHDPEYEALSYAWGDPTQTCVIKCNDRELPIPAILYEALRGLRYETDERVLWADAVCINQEDPEERGHQVQIMQEIYSNAQRVIVWLGEEKVEDQFAFDSLRSLDLYLNDHTPKPSTGGFGWFVDTDGTPISGPDKENLSEFKWGQIANLLRRQWFRRTWVIQEVASARQVILKCSSQEMQWRDFANAFMQLDESGLRVNILEEGKARHARESIAAMETLRRSQNGPMSMSLLEVLLGTCYNNCSDPRDKIYAVLGLATDWSKEQELKPDYTIGAEEAFQNLAVWDICHNVSLRVLSCASGPEAANDLTLPSWVPDWRHVENAHPFIRYSDRTHFSAAGRTSPVAWFSSDRNVLHIVGKYIDTLRAVGSVPNYTRGIILASIDPTTVHLLKESWRWLQECQKLLPKMNTE